MAARKKKTKRPPRKRTTKKRTTAPAPSAPAVLDLTGEPDRPTVRLPAGDYKMRVPQELTFEEIGAQVRAGKAMIEAAPKLDQDGVAEELQALIVGSATVLLIDLDAEAAATITPDQHTKILAFFNELGDAIAT